MYSPMDRLLSDVEERAGNDDMDWAFERIQQLDEENKRLRARIAELEGVPPSLRQMYEKEDEHARRESALPIDLVRPRRITLLREED